ncbi:MAG TPA: hypothetical protein VLE46_07290 [Nitrospira sp.]|nr:hypothetical protein [Nitrospira sp.]
MSVAYDLACILSGFSRAPTFFRTVGLGSTIGQLAVLRGELRRVLSTVPPVSFVSQLCVIAG